MKTIRKLHRPTLATAMQLKRHLQDFNAPALVVERQIEPPRVMPEFRYIVAKREADSKKRREEWNQ